MLWNVISNYDNENITLYIRQRFICDNCLVSALCIMSFNSHKIYVIDTVIFFHFPNVVSESEINNHGHGYSADS